MKKNKNLSVILILFSLFLYSCQTATEALQGKKRSDQSDEFLVEKKNPLAMPPDFDKLPTPGNQEVSTEMFSDNNEVKDLLNAFKIFKRGNYPNLVSVCISNKNPYYNMIEKNKKEVKIVKKTKFNIYNRQEAPKIYDVNASIYIWKRSSLLKSKNIINSNTGLYVMPKSRSIDIDDIDDFELVKYYMGKKER